MQRNAAAMMWLDKDGGGEISHAHGKSGIGPMQFHLWNAGVVKRNENEPRQGPTRAESGNEI